MLRGATGPQALPRGAVGPQALPHKAAGHTSTAQLCRLFGCATARELQPQAFYNIGLYLKIAKSQQKINFDE